MVAKLSGFAKFEVDLKLTQDQFCQLLMNCVCGDAGSVSTEKFETILDVCEKAFAEGATPPYAGDLENETYKDILQKIREFMSS